MLGLYVSDHPLFGAQDVLRERTDTTVAELGGGDHPDGAVVTIGGIVSAVRRRTTRQGNPWAAATVEDLAGSIECVFFPAIYQLVADDLVEDAVVLVKGRLDKREDVPRLVAMELAVPDLSSASSGAPVVIDIPRAKLTPPLVGRLADLLAGHRGSTEVRVRVLDDGHTTLLRLDPRHRVAPAPALFDHLRRLLGS
jgi:DNA polymerase III subunit alpha